MTNNLFEQIKNSTLNFNKPFLFVGGTFGVGKSHYINKAIEQLVSSKSNILFVKFDLSTCKHIHQILNHINLISNLKGLGFVYDEVNFFIEKYKNLIENLTVRNEQLANVFYTAYNLYDYYETDYLGINPLHSIVNYNEQINQSFEKKIDKRVLLKFFDVLSEAIIYSIFQILHHNNIREKLQVIFIFDNYERVDSIVDYWILNHLYRYFVFKNFGEFESYEIIDGLKNKKACDFIQFKFILISRFNFTLRKLLSTEPEDKIDIIRLEPFDKDKISEYLDQSKCEISPNEVLNLTFGIPFVIEKLHKHFNFDLTENKRKEFFEIIYQKIIERINPKLQDTLQLISVADFFSEETLRTLPENYPNHEKIYKYFVNNNELCLPNKYLLDAYQIRESYKFYITNYLKQVDENQYENYCKILSYFTSNIEIFKTLNKEERKILRNLAYLREFTLGEILQNIFQEDYPKIKKFIEERSSLFNYINDKYYLPEEIRNNLLELNKIVDNKRYDEKNNFIQEIVKYTIEKIKKEIGRLELEKSQKQDKIKKINNIKSKISLEIQEIQKNIVCGENYLIELHSRKYKTNRKYIWLPFILLTFMSIIIFLAGNNIMLFFGEAINIEPIKGLGTALKILSILLFGVLIYLIIDTFASKDKKQAMERAEIYLREEEEKIRELKECLNEYKNAFKQFENEFSQTSKEIESLEKEIYEKQKNLQFSL